MNGNSTGVEQSDARRAVDATDERDWEQTQAVLDAAEKALEEIGEYKAAREVGDARARLKTTRAASEGQRSGETVHGVHPQKTQVDFVEQQEKGNALPIETDGGVDRPHA